MDLMIDIISSGFSPEGIPNFVSVWMRRLPSPDISRGVKVPLKNAPKNAGEPLPDWQVISLPWSALWGRFVFRGSTLSKPSTLVDESPATDLSVER